MTADDLIAFEKRVIDAFTAKDVKGPVHLCGGNEQQLIHIFKDVHRDDWCFATYRSHYAALLHGVPGDWLFKEICEGRSMNIFSPEHRFVTSAIVGGCLPMAVGVAAALKRKGEPRRVWCFVGDMCETTGAFHEATRYARGHDLPITFCVESNGFSCNSPTDECWGREHDIASKRYKVMWYSYKRTFPHVGTGQFVSF